MLSSLLISDQYINHYGITEKKIDLDDKEGQGYARWKKAMTSEVHVTVWDSLLPNAHISVFYPPIIAVVTVPF